MDDPDDARVLRDEEITEYLGMVGILLWISGVRRDITYAVTYLTWSTRAPRVHHARMALQVINYLFTTVGTPLVLGGPSEPRLHTWADASYGTGPKGRSVGGYYISLGPKAGAIVAKSRASTYVRLSSFEAELEFFCTSLKTMTRLSTLLSELEMTTPLPIIHGDNKAMLDFVQGDGIAKGVRHIEIKMYYAREMFNKGGFEVKFIRGPTCPQIC